MTPRSVLHSTFETTRRYPVPPGRVFAAWADPAVKGGWFAPGAAYELDFRVGGGEVVRTARDDGTPLTFESRYHDIVDGERIVYASTLTAAGVPATVSLTTVQLVAAGDGTELRLTEQDAFLDGQEERTWREQGTGGWLDALGAELTRR